jgi:hypothetical protein
MVHKTVAVMVSKRMYWDQTDSKKSVIINRSGGLQADAREYNSQIHLLE